MPPWMTDTVLVAVLTAGLTLIGSIITAHHQQQQTEHNIQSRITTKVMETAGVSYQALAADLARLRAQNQQQEDRIRRLEHDQATLHAREHQWQTGWDDLHARWPWWRTHKTPPPYPAPPLADRKDDTA